MKPIKQLFFLLLISASFVGCSNVVNYEFVGAFNRVGEFTTTINGKPTYEDPFRLLSSYNRLLNTCSDQPMEEEVFIENCVQLTDADIDQIKDLLLKCDLLITKQPVKTILKDSEYTRSDGCDYWLHVAEVVLDESVKEQDKIYMYTVWPKNYYRLHLCP